MPHDRSTWHDRTVSALRQRAACAVTSLRSLWADDVRSHYRGAGRGDASNVGLGLTRSGLR